VHVTPRAPLFCGKFRAALRQTPRFTQGPAETWKEAWVGDGRAGGSGRPALNYLAPSVLRVALRNHRRGAVAHDQVTFRDQAGAPGQPRICPLPAEEFLQRLLPHGLPTGCVKVRSEGRCSPGNRHLLNPRRPRLALATGAAAAQPARDPPPALTPS